MKETGPLETILLSCGSELQHAIAAAKELGAGTRVVSMPCFERFEAQAEAYREVRAARSCRRRVAIEAGVTDSGINTSGSMARSSASIASASAGRAIVMEELGITAQSVVDAVKSLA